MQPHFQLGVIKASFMQTYGLGGEQHGVDPVDWQMKTQQEHLTWRNDPVTLP